MKTSEVPARLTLREGQVRTAAEFALTPEIVRDMLLERHTTITPEHEIQLCSDEWRALSTLPELVPWQEIQARAIQCLADGDAMGAQIYATRLRAFDPQRIQETTSLASFILGHLEQLRGSPHARVLYGQALSGPLIVRAAALSNMGVDDVLRSRDVVSAEHHFTEAILSEPMFLPACINQARLRAQLALERAPAIPGEPTWAELAQESGERLREAGMAQAAHFLSRTFPGCACIHLLPASFGPPPLGLRLPPSDVGLEAARETLAAAVEAGREGRHETAVFLADLAAAESRSVASSAAPVRRAAAEQAQREHRRETAQHRRKLLDDFDRELAAERWERVEEILCLLPELLTEATCKHAAKRLDQALAEHYRYCAGESGDARQAAHFYSLAAQYLQGEARETCEEQAWLLRLREPRRQFRLACEGDKRTWAGQVALRLRRRGAFPRLLEAVERWLKAMIPLSATEATSVRRAESLYAQAEEQIRQGRLDMAKRLVEELRREAPAEPLVTELERRLISAEHLAEAREHARHGSKQETMASLELSLELDPRNTDALALLAEAELRQRFGRGPNYFDVKLTVQRALQELKCAQYQDLAGSLRDLQQVSDARFYLLLAANLPPAQQQQTPPTGTP